MRFQIVTGDLGPNNDQLGWVEYDGLEAVIAAGFEQTGTSRTGGMLRPMLQGQPTFKGFGGPMYGKSYETGEECLRYESFDANDRLSA